MSLVWQKSHYSIPINIALAQAKKNLSSKDAKSLFNDVQNICNRYIGEIDKKQQSKIK